MKIFKKEAPAQEFSCEFGGFFRINFFTELLRTTASKYITFLRKL